MMGYPRYWRGHIFICYLALALKFSLCPSLKCVCVNEMHVFELEIL